MESKGGMILTGENRRTPRETCPSATFSATNPKWTEQGANPGLRGERQATNRLSHGTVNAYIDPYYKHFPAAVLCSLLLSLVYVQEHV
jgi:hypothetical protein